VLASRLPGSLGLRWLGARTLPVFVTHTSVVLALLYLLYSNGIWIPAPQSQWLPVVLCAAAIGVGLGLGALAPRIGARWLFAPPHRLAGGRRPR